MKNFVICCLLAFSMASAMSLAQSSTASDSTKPDNTKVNQRDRDKTQLTADQQKENKSDRETARQIRRSIVKDKSLSTDAHNVKIIAQGGTVTLKGPVRTDEEKAAVEKKAAEVAGESNVKSEIEVAPKSGH